MLLKYGLPAAATAAGIGIGAALALSAPDDVSIVREPGAIAGGVVGTGALFWGAGKMQSKLTDPWVRMTESLAGIRATDYIWKESSAIGFGAGLLGGLLGTALLRGAASDG